MREIFLSARSPVSRQNPAARMVVEADMAVVVGRGRGGQQDEVAARAELILRVGDEFHADALPLVGHVHGQVGQVAAVDEVGHGAGHADEQLAVPGGHGQVGVGEHAGDGFGVVHRPALGQGGAAEEVDEGGGGEGGGCGVVDHGLVIQ